MKKKKWRKYLTGFLVICLAAGVLGWWQKRRFFINEIIRPAAVAGEDSVILSVYGIREKPVKVEVSVSPAKLESEAIEALLEESWNQVLTLLPGENESIERVEKNLNLVGGLSNGVQIEWYSSDPSLINWDGEIDAGITEETRVTMVAILCFQGQELYKTQEIVLYPEELSGEEQKKKDAEEALLQAEEDMAKEERIVLPEKIGEAKVRYHRETGEIKPLTLFCLGCLILVLTALTEKSGEKEAAEKRKKQLQLDYSEVVTLLTIYLGAGLSVRNAWSAIVQEHAGSKRACFEEMAVTERAMKAGCFEGQAYQEFGHRTQVTAYIRLGNLLAQNLRKGPKSLLGNLEAELTEAFEERKRIARRQGEEAGTKLMLPMFLMFGVILLYLMVPIMLSLSL